MFSISSFFKSFSFGASHKDKQLKQSLSQSDKQVRDTADNLERLSRDLAESLTGNQLLVVRKPSSCPQER